MLKEYPFGIESTNIIPLLTQSLGFPFQIKSYGCHSVYEFINKFVIPTTEIDIINNKPDMFTIRSKQIYAHMPKLQNKTFQKQNTSSSGKHASNNS